MGTRIAGADIDLVGGLVCGQVAEKIPDIYESGFRDLGFKTAALKALTLGYSDLATRDGGK